MCCWLPCSVPLTFAFGATKVLPPLRGATMSTRGESRRRGLNGTCIRYKSHKQDIFAGRCVSNILLLCTNTTCSANRQCTPLGARLAPSSLQGMKHAGGLLEESYRWPWTASHASCGPKQTSSICKTAPAKPSDDPHVDKLQKLCCNIAV